LVVQANADPIVHPRSADYIYRHIGSGKKEIYWFNCRHHASISDNLKNGLFAKANQFIREIISLPH